MAKKQTTPCMTINRTFGSLQTFSKWLASTPVTPGFNPRWGSEDPDYDFTGTANFETANKLMLDGWDYGKDAVSKIMNERFEGVQQVKRLALSYVGAVPCIPAYMAGSPKNMIAVKRRSVPRPVVSIVYNCSIRCGVTSNEIRTAAAKLFNVIRGLELGGVSVELWVASFSTAGGDNVNMAVKIKSAGQPLNVLNMCYPIVHPSFNRRHKFAFIERCELDPVTWNEYGRAVKDTDEMARRAEALGIKNPNCFHFRDLENRNEKQIAELIK